MNGKKLPFLPAEWKWHQRVLAYVTATILAGNDYKERVALGPPAVLAALFRWASLLGPLATLEGGRVQLDKDCVHRFILVIFATARGVPENEIKELLRQSQADLRDAHDHLRALIALKLARKRKVEDGSLPDFAATRHMIGRTYTVLTYNASVLHGERSFEPDRWCEHEGWLKRDPSGGDDAANFAFWWGDSATSPIVGPIIKRASTAGASTAGHGTKRATAVRATKADYAKLTELASSAESPTNERLAQVLRTLERPLTLEQARRFVNRARSASTTPVAVHVAKRSKTTQT